MNDTDMSVQLREGSENWRKKAWTREPAWYFTRCFFNSCEASNLLTVCMLKVIHRKYHVDPKHLMLGVYETRISDVSFLIVVCNQEV